MEPVCAFPGACMQPTQTLLPNTNTPHSHTRTTLSFHPYPHAPNAQAHPCTHTRTHTHEPMDAQRMDAHPRLHTRTPTHIYPYPFTHAPNPRGFIDHVCRGTHLPRVCADSRHPHTHPRTLVHPHFPTHSLTHQTRRVL